MRKSRYVSSTMRARFFSRARSANSEIKDGEYVAPVYKFFFQS